MSHQGAPASERTEVWVFFDANNVYVSARCYETRPDRAIANELRRDNLNVVQNDNFGFLLDTFHDRRSSFSFCINPIGGRCDGQSSNEGQYNGDWNGVWKVETGRWDGGWTIEMALPFRTLRYPAKPVQDWGIQILRINRWKNEVVFMTPSDPSRGSAGFMLASKFADVVGLEAPPPGRNIEVKPYTIGSLTTDRLSRPAKSNATDGNVGLDVKYAVKQSIAADFTELRNAGCSVTSGTSLPSI